MTDVAGPATEQQAVDIARRHLLGYERDVLRERPLWLRVFIEFFGTAALVTVAAGSGVINKYVGTDPISRTAAVIAPGAIVMALIYAWGPLSGLHINPAVTLAFAARRDFHRAWVLPYLVAQLGGAVFAAWILQIMYGHVSAGGNFPITTPGGEWRSFVMEIICTLILVTVILNTATGYRSIGHNAALAVGATVALLGLFASPISGASMNPFRTLGPDIVAVNFTGWWVYVFGDSIGALAAVGMMYLVRGDPATAERGAAEGDALPL